MAPTSQFPFGRRYESIRREGSYDFVYTKKLIATRSSIVMYVTGEHSEQAWPTISSIRSNKFLRSPIVLLAKLSWRIEYPTLQTQEIGGNCV